jgi:hypothetical protein
VSDKPKKAKETQPAGRKRIFLPEKTINLLHNPDESEDEGLEPKPEMPATKASKAKPKRSKS